MVARFDPHVSRTTRMSVPSGATQRAVKVEEIGPSTALCIDSSGQLYKVRYVIARTRLRPRVGEHWLIDQSYTGAWTFAALVDDPNPVEVTGVVPPGPMAGMVQILDELGLIDNQTTPGGAPVELAGVLKTGSWEALLSGALAGLGLVDDDGVTVGASRQFPNTSGASDANMRLLPSTHVDSERASIEFGSVWTVGVDPDADGGDDRFFWSHGGTTVLTVDDFGNMAGEGNVAFVGTAFCSDVQTREVQTYLTSSPGGASVPLIEFKGTNVFTSSLSVDTNGWSERVGDWKVDVGFLYVDTSGGTNIITRPSGLDHDIRATIAANSVTSGKGLVLRWSDANNYIYIVSTPTGWDIIERVAGTETTLDSLTASSGVGAIARARVSGVNLRVWIDGELLGETTIDAALTGTEAGFLLTAANEGTDDGFADCVILEASGATDGVSVYQTDEDTLSMAFAGDRGIDFTATGISGSAFKFTSWSPTITQSVTISHTIAYGKYMTILGKIGIACLHTSFTSGGTSGTHMVMTLPFTLETANSGFGGGYYYRNGSNIYSVAVNSDTTTSIKFIANGFVDNLGAAFGAASADGFKIFVVGFLA